MTPNRVVALLTPTVFAPAAGLCSSWIAAHVPGVNISSHDMQAIFIAGALIALAPAAQWLHGWQKYEARQADAEHDVEMANVAAVAASPAVQSASQVDADAADVDDMAILDGLDDFSSVDDLDSFDQLLPEESTTTAH